MPSPYFGIPDAPYARCVQIANNAINAWKTLVITVAAENMAMGITQSGKTKLVSDALAEVIMYGGTGSLREAYLALDRVKITPEMYPYITADRIIWMKNELNKIIASL